jgi:hypothetical protein
VGGVRNRAEGLRRPGSVCRQRPDGEKVDLTIFLVVGTRIHTSAPATAATILSAAATANRIWLE